MGLQWRRALSDIWYFSSGDKSSSKTYKSILGGFLANLQGYKKELLQPEKTTDKLGSQE